MIQNCVFVMLGGAVGALLRFGIAQLCSHCTVISMPVGTFTANLIGCFVLGLLTSVGESHTGIPRQLMLMLTVGMCGAFTTFSTFTSETIRAFDNGQVLSAVIYVVSSVTLGLLLFWVGKSINI